MEDGCVFCKIIAGQAKTEILYQDELVTAFPDQRPITPVHILIVPNKHIRSVNEIDPDDREVIGHLVLTARQLAHEHGLSDSGYRLAINTGPDAGQTIYHIHLHLIGGRRMPFRFE